MKSTVSVGSSVNSSRFSHLDALLDKFFQTNKQDKKRQEALIPLRGRHVSLNSRDINTINSNNIHSSQFDIIPAAVDASKQANTQDSQQQLSQNNVYAYSSDSDSEDNIIEQFYSKDRPETSVTVSQQSQQQQQPSQNTFFQACSQENLKISEKQPLSYEKSIDQASSNKYNGQLLDQSRSKSATKPPETQTIQQKFAAGPMQKYKLQCGPNYSIDEQKQLKYLNYTAKIIEGLKSQRNQDTCGQKKNGIQNSQIPYISSTASCLNNQLPTIFQCSKNDNQNQNNQGDKSYSQFSNTPPLQQYPQEDIEGEVECDKNMSFRKKFSSNGKESLISKGQSSDSKTQLPETKSGLGADSLMGSSFTLRKVSPTKNNFEKISRHIFQQGHEESDDEDDEDGDEMEELKAIARQQQEKRKGIKEISLDDSVSIIPCMNDITQILNQFQDKDKTARQEQEIKKEKIKNNARKVIQSKPIQKPERVNGRVSDIKKSSESKTSTINEKRTRYQFYDDDNEEEENWNGRYNDDDDGEESSSDFFQKDFEAGFTTGKDKNSFMPITNDPKAPKKQGFASSKDPKKKICLEKHKARVESSEEEARKANRQNMPTKPQRSSLSSTSTITASFLQQNQVKRNANNSSNSTNRLSGGNAMVSECKRRELRDPKVLYHRQQDKKSKKKQIVDSDEEFEAEMNRQKNLKKQKRDTRKIHKDEESSYSEQSLQIKEYNEVEDDDEDIQFNENYEYEERENTKRGMTIQNSGLLDRRRVQLNSQRSLSQQQSQSQSKLSQLLSSQKQRISQFSQHACQLAASPSPSSQRMPLQQSKDIEKGEKKIKKKLVKAAHIEDFATFQCTICLDQPSDPFFGEIDCQHRFCFKCILNWSKVTNQCPMCRTEFSQILKRNFNGTVTKNQPLTFVRRKKQKIHESYYLEEAQALQDEEDRQAAQQQAATEPAVCYKCLRSENQNLLLICDVCDENYCHTFCDETLTSRRVPEGRWACHSCRF